MISPSRPAGQDVIDEIQRRLYAADLAGVTAALDEQRRAIDVLRQLLVGDGDLPDVAAFERLSDGIQLDEVRYLAAQPFSNPTVSS